MFDNAPGHQKRAHDALSARKLPKNLKLGWTHVKNGPKMHLTTLPDGSVQDLYFLANHETLSKSTMAHVVYNIFDFLQIHI